MLRLLTDKGIAKIRQKMYEQGLRTGYLLGYRMGRSDKTHLGFITGAVVREQVEEILKRNPI